MDIHGHVNVEVHRTHRAAHVELHRLEPGSNAELYGGNDEQASSLT